MTGHTPRPWEIVWERNKDHNGPKRAESVGPITADHDHWSGWTICDEADAYLASAAPDLLAALERSLDSLCGWICRPDKHAAPCRDARAALAKAKGN